MLKITVNTSDSFNETTGEFVTESFELLFEHSLATLSKWESIHEKAYLSPVRKTEKELISYLEVALQTKNPPEDWLGYLSASDIDKINRYFEAKHSATWFREDRPTSRSETITAELIYYWMITLGVPFECERWHLNRLFTLLRVIGAKTAKPKPMSKSALAERNRTLNAERRAKYGTKG